MSLSREAPDGRDAARPDISPVILRDVGHNRPLAEVLDETCRLAETLLPGARCTVLLHDRATGTLRHGGAPSMPDDVITTIDHLPVAVGSGACGTAVATGQPMLIADVYNHPYMAPFMSLARKHSLAACWSVPLRAGNQLIGAFAAYYTTPRTPTADELARVESCARLAALVLEQNATHQAQAESEANFRTAAELVPGHVFIIRPDGQRLYANAYYETHTGVPSERLQGEGWRAVLHPDDAEPTLASYFAAVHHGEPWDGRFRIRMGDGAYRWFMSRMRPQQRPDGSVAALVGVEVDIDDLVTAQELLTQARADLEQKVAERTRDLEQAAAQLQAEMAQREAALAALAQSQKVEALGQLTGGVAHDFNNMLSAIMGGLELIERRSADPAVLKLTRSGLQTCERAASLVRQLLAVARRDPPKPTLVDPAQALPQLRNLLRHAVHGGIELSIEVTPGTWPVLVDPPQLETTLLNLALNARDAMPTGGRLAVTAWNTTQSGRDYVCIRVADSGCGIPPDLIARVFEPFFTTKPRGGGTGLGLAMVQGFVRQAGGDITVESAPGEGTVISLYLPRATVAGEAPQAAATPDRGATVLVVDDDDAVRAIATAFLRDAGYRVIEANGARLALALLESVPVDLVLTDLAMPGMDGMQLAEAVRADRPTMPVVFVTGYGEQYNLSSETTVQKPYAAATLLRTVAAAIKKN